ncbi:MAG: DHHW family protein, partial [Eubacterium sp.]
TEISGELDFANDNADELLNGLSGRNIGVLDLRENIHQAGLNHHELFYVTDHHWKAETGLWAAGEISNYLNEQYDLGIETDLLDITNFTSVLYEDWFLGSLGKKVTLGKTEPEDFSLLYPNFPTQFHYEIPSIGIDTVGDFSVTYNMEAVEPKDYYNKSPYAAYNYGDRAVIKIENQNASSDEKVLIVHDSFADSVIPFMALGTKNIESIDLRYFNGSLEKFIDDSDPDLVIVMYNAGEISSEIDFTTHTDIFDFR